MFATCFMAATTTVATVSKWAMAAKTIKMAETGTKLALTVRKIARKAKSDK